VSKYFKGYRIEEVSEETGLSRRQIHWIAHHKLVTPQGISKGAYYTPSDVSKLKAIKELLELGFSPNSLLKLKENSNIGEVLSDLNFVLDLPEGRSRSLGVTSQRLESLLHNLPNDMDITISRRSLPISGIESRPTPTELSTSMLEDWS